MRLVVLNTHSMLNAGDATISLCQLRVLREVLGPAEITVTSRTPELDRRLYDSPDVCVLPPLFPAPSVFSTAAQRLAGTARGLAAVRPKRQLLAAIRRADLVVSSGGGYLFSARRTVPGPMFLQAWAQVRVAQRMGRPVLFAPQSFGPLANRPAERLLRRLLADGRVRAVLAREEASLDLVRNLLGGTGREDTASLCPDLAFLAEERLPEASAVPPEMAALPPPRLAVTVRDWLSPGRSARRRGARRHEYVEAVASACGAFCRRTGGSVAVLPHARGPGALEDDRAVSAELHGRLQGTAPGGRTALVDLPGDALPARVEAAVGAADVVLGTRFHSVILALVAGVPAVALGYQPKSLGMMRMMGLERYCLPMDGAEPDRLADLLVELAERREQLAAEVVRPAVAAMRTAAETGMRAALEPFLTAPGARS